MNDLMPLLWVLIAAAGTFFGLAIGYALGFAIGHSCATERWFYYPCQNCGSMPRRNKT